MRAPPGTTLQAPGSTDELAAFCAACPIAGGPDTILVGRLLTHLIRGPEAVLDLWRAGERQAVAVVIDTCANAEQSASLELLGMRALHVDDITTLLTEAEAITLGGPYRRLDLALPPERTSWAPLLVERGYAPAYTMFVLERPGTAPPAPPRAPLPEGWRWEPLTEARFADYHRVVSHAFADLPGSQVPGPDEMARGLRLAKLRPEVLLAEDRLIAYAAVAFDEESATGEVRSLGRDPPARGRGLGDHILARAMSRLLALGATRLTLEVAGQNAAALSLYTRHGFTQMSEIQVWRREL